jgi:hypothetical protein
MGREGAPPHFGVPPTALTPTFGLSLWSGHALRRLAARGTDSRPALTLASPIASSRTTRSPGTSGLRRRGSATRS